MEQNQPEYANEELSEILKVRREKLAALRELGEDPFESVKFERTSSANEIIENFDALCDTNVSVAGRLMSKRGMGKASFSDMLDRTGKIQLYIRRDEIGAEEYDKFKKLDIGDIVGISGEVFKTQKGEISVKVEKLTLLAKSLRPLPEKWHGLKDADLRYRQRYVDLIVNPEVKKTFILRSRIIKEIRAFLDGRGYLEVDTPMLNTIPGGAAARPFITHHNTLGMDMYLRIATELHLKRLIVGGLEKVYEMGRIFRNEGMSVKHNPEFTSIELYEAYSDYKDMMKLTEDLVFTVAQNVLGTGKIVYQGREIDLAPPWPRITMAAAVEKYTAARLGEPGDAKAALAAAKTVGLDVSKNASWGEIVYEIFDNIVEEKLVDPVFITDYPVEVSPLAKKKKDCPILTERFEFFIAAREMGNAFSELNDPIDQRERFLKQVAAREAGDDEANMMDDDYINALEYGMPPTGGLGIGIDRLVMLLTDSYSIRDVLLFPTMRPIQQKVQGAPDEI